MITIVTTTINKPTEATKKYVELCKKKGFTFIIVGDTKTPHTFYQQLERELPEQIIYLTPEKQEELYKELSDCIGWKTIQRRNIGLVHAYKLNKDNIIATVDDDNIPYECWGDDVKVGKEVEVDFYDSESIVFDPLSVTEHNWLWHRGFPVEEIPVKNNITYLGKRKTKVLVQANLWDGDPDIDATNRLTKRPLVKFSNIEPYTTDKITVFNSQNTFIDRSILKYYSVLPFVGRMDDIWGCYYLQNKIERGSIIFDKPTVYQDRNEQDLVTNLENEIIGYRNTLDLINNKYEFEDKTKEFIKIYTQSFS